MKPSSYACRRALVGALLGALAFLNVGGAAFAQQAILRNGSCPSGYHASGNYCAPGAQARPVIERNGSCPSGYSASGDYCLMGANGRPAIHRVGSCPSGYSASGAYCESTR